MQPHLVAIVIALNNNSLRMLLGFLEIQNKQSMQIIFKMGSCQTNSENGSETYKVIRTNFCNGSNLLMCTIIVCSYSNVTIFAFGNFYDHFWSFLCQLHEYLSQNLDDDVHFEVLNVSKFK